MLPRARHRRTARGTPRAPHITARADAEKYKSATACLCLKATRIHMGTHTEHTPTSVYIVGLPVDQALRRALSQVVGVHHIEAVGWLAALAHVQQHIPVQAHSGIKVGVRAFSGPTALNSIKWHML